MKIKGMKVYNITKMVKREYDIVIEMLGKGANRDYWFGRSTALGELLDEFQKYKVDSYKSCKFCFTTFDGCKDCYK